MFSLISNTNIQVLIGFVLGDFQKLFKYINKLIFLSNFSDFPGTDENNTVGVFGHDITVITGAGQHDSGSSKVKLKNIVDYTWEERFYTGTLLAVHMGGKYIAYGIKGELVMGICAYCFCFNVL